MDDILIQSKSLQAMLTFQQQTAETAARRLIAAKLGIDTQGGQQGARSALAEFQRVGETLCGFMNTETSSGAREKAREILSYLEVVENLEQIVTQGRARCFLMEQTETKFLPDPEDDEDFAHTLAQARARLDNHAKHLKVARARLDELLEDCDIPKAASSIDLVQT